MLSNCTIIDVDKEIKTLCFRDSYLTGVFLKFSVESDEKSHCEGTFSGILFRIVIAKEFFECLKQSRVGEKRYHVWGSLI
jgi:hypothetical protein